MMDNKTTIIAMTLLILGWTIIPFLKKIPLEKITPISFLLFNHVTVGILLLFYLIYLLYHGKFTKTVVSQYNNLSTREILFIVIISIIGLITGIAWITLIKNNYVSYVIPHIQPIILMLTLILSYFFFKEPINRYHIGGSFLVVSGLVLINLGKMKLKNKDRN